MYYRGRELGKLIIQLAPTGIVPTKETNPSLPVSPDEIIEQTLQAYRMGVSSVHIHARDEKGRPTTRKDIYEEIIAGIRNTCPDIIICASTSGRVKGGRRDEVLELAPDMASLTLGSVTFRDSVSINSSEEIVNMARLMAKNGIKPEIEVFEAGFINTAQYLHKKGILVPPMFFNFLLGSLGSIPADVRDLVYLVESLPGESNWAAAGIGRFQMQVAAASILMGGHVRIGLEDSTFLEFRNRTLTTNEELVRKVNDMANCLGREIASPREARKILGLNPPGGLEC